jgi:hypothetical protein
MRNSLLSVLSRTVATDLAAPKTKKADVAEHPKEFHHVGLLID